MKRYKTLLQLLTIILLIPLTFSCEDEDKSPFLVITENVKNAGGLRTVEITDENGQNTGGSFHVNFLDVAAYNLEVEAWDSNDGNLLETVDVFVSFEDRSADSSNGDSDVDDTLLTTLSASDFTVNDETGLPRTVIEIKASDVLETLSLSSEDLVAGSDRIRVNLILKLSDGQSFSADNLQGSVTGPFFNSPFTYLIPFVI